MISVSLFSSFLLTVCSI